MSQARVEGPEAACRQRLGWRSDLLPTEASQDLLRWMEKMEMATQKRSLTPPLGSLLPSGLSVHSLYFLPVQVTACSLQNSLQKDKMFLFFLLFAH